MSTFSVEVSHYALDGDRSTATSALLAGSITHKSSLSEVLVTKVANLSAHSVVVGLQWPRMHYFYDTRSETADTLLLAESLRQMTVAIAHSLLEVPFDRKFVLTSLAIDDVRPIPAFSPSRPTDVLVKVAVTAKMGGAMRVQGLRLEVDFTANGLSFATGSIDTRVLDPATYQRLRCSSGLLRSVVEEPGDASGKHGRPGRFTRSASATVSKLEGDSGWVLTPDLAHPLFFDHPLDHVPGMFVVEAIRQALSEHLEVPAHHPVAIAISYWKMVELDESCTLRLISRPSDETKLDVELSQHGHIVVTGSVSSGAALLFEPK